jgi:cobalt-zinc-cadmium efflux system protein
MAAESDQGASPNAGDACGCAHDHHHHHHDPSDFGRAFLIGIGLNAAFVGIEWIFGVLANSLALLADATHNLGDVLGLAMAWGAGVLARRLPSERFTYGLRGTTILAALANAILLMLVSGGIAWEALQRLSQPPGVAGRVVMAVAAAGVLVNGFSAWLFARGRHDLNVRGAYLHMAADAALSLAVVAGGGIVLLTGWTWIDPVLSLLLVAVIVGGTWGLLRDSLRLALQAVPESIRLAEVRSFLAAQPGVDEVHDLHIWGMSTTENALTAHLIVRNGHPGDEFLHQLGESIEHRFGIHHVTIQVELGGTDRACRQAPDHVV